MDKIKVVAVIGSESHTSSRGWSKISVNGSSRTWRDAISSNWLTKFGDKHASWCECVFEVPNGATVAWEAGANSGNRGSDRKRQNLVFVADASAEVYQSEDIGYPANVDVTIKGRLRLVEDTKNTQAENHQALVNSL